MNNSNYDPNWKDNPGIQLAKKACEENDGQMAVVIVVQRDGNMKGFSYGAGKRLCKIAGELLDKAMDCLGGK